MAPTYTNSKIYVIRNGMNEKLYVGSTTSSLSKRMVQHRSDAKTNRPGYEFPLYVAMRELGIEHFYIELLEDFPCERKEQLNKKEGERIREMKTLAPIGYNARIAGRSVETWHAEHPEKTKTAKQAYEDRNRVALNAKSRARYSENLDANRASARERSNKSYVVNAEAIKAKARERRAATKLMAAVLPPTV